MRADEHLTAKITEMRYLNADNVERYRCIMRIFYENYEKLRYWMYQEDVYEAMSADPYFREYTQEQCQQDLTMLAEWRNLVTVQDTRNVRTVDEFRSRKFRYMMSEYSVEIERLVQHLENLHVEGASLEPSLLERIRLSVEQFPRMRERDGEEIYTWWNDLNNDFIRLNQNYQDYIRDLSGVKAEEMMKTQAFLLFKDRLVEYLRGFIRSLQKNAGMIEETLRNLSADLVREVLSREVDYDLAIPRVDSEVTRQILWERAEGRYRSIYDWFAGDKAGENEAGRLFDATNEIIRRITRYAARLSEQNALGLNRRQEYRKVADMFLRCGSLEEAHCLSAVVFGLERPRHLRLLERRQTESMNSSVYEEKAAEYLLKSRVRSGREKENRSALVDTSALREKVRAQTIRRMKKQQKKLRALEKDGVITFSALPVIEPQVRQVLLKWLSDAMESEDHSARTEEGRQFRLLMPLAGEKCVIHCTDGHFMMPAMKLVFAQEEDDASGI